MNTETMQVALMVARIFLGGIFLTSAIGKLLNWRSYVESVAAYDILHSPVFIHDPEVTLTDEATIGVVANQNFLGRVIVEFWDGNRTVIGLSGVKADHPRIVQQAIYLLETTPL